MFLLEQAKQGSEMRLASTATPKTARRSGLELVARSLALLPKTVVHPRRTAREFLSERTIYPSLIVVLGFAVLESLLSLISYLAGSYPPPPEVLKIWIEAWGEFAMLPFIRVPAESYRLAMAVFMVPLMLAIWMLMAGSARLLSILFGRVSFDGYLNLLGFSFFAFFIIAVFLDALVNGVFGGFELAALRGEYGPLLRSVFVAFPAVEYTVLFGLGGVYNAIVAREAEGYSIPKTAVVGFVTFLWPMVLVSLLLR